MLTDKNSMNKIKILSVFIWDNKHSIGARWDWFIVFSYGLPLKEVDLLIPLFGCKLASISNCLPNRVFEVT